MSNLDGEDLKTTEKIPSEKSQMRKKYFKVANTIFSATKYTHLTDVIRLVDPKVWTSEKPTPSPLKIIQLDIPKDKLDYTFFVEEEE